MAYKPAKERVSKLDVGNSAVRTVLDGATQFIGTPYDTRNPTNLSERIVAAQQLIFASNVPIGLGGTFIFQFSNDPTFTIINVAEVRIISDFSTVRDLTLQNVGDYFRILFTPSRPLIGVEFLVIETTQWYIAPPQFVRLANQSIELANAAFPNYFAYIQAFNSLDKSEPIRAENGGLRISTAKTNTYHAAFRTLTSPNYLVITLTAALTKQAATIYHTALSTKKLKLRRVTFILANVGNAGDVSIDLLRITTAPIGGTVILPSPAKLTNPVTEAILQALPTTQGTVSTILSTNGLKLATADKNIQIELFDSRNLTDIQVPSIDAGVLGGFAVMLRSGATTTLSGNVNMVFTEE